MIAFFLFVLSMFTTRGYYRWWALAGVILTMMLSMGNNLDGFNAPFFDYVPFYNKFRTPNSILSVTAILIAFMAFYGLNELFKTKNRASLLMPLYIVTAIFAVLCLYFAFIAPSSMSLSSAGDARYAQQG